MQSESRGSIVSGSGPSYSSCGIRCLRPVRRSPLFNSYGCNLRIITYATFSKANRIFFVYFSVNVCGSLVVNASAG